MSIPPQLLLLLFDLVGFRIVIVVVVVGWYQNGLVLLFVCFGWWYDLFGC